MRHFAFLLSICWLGIAVGVVSVSLADARAAQPDGAAPSSVDPSELRADLRAMLRTFEQVHPDLYRYTSRRTIRALVDDLTASLDGSISTRRAYVVAARLAAAFDDGHTRVDFPQAIYADAARRGARTFPFTVRPSQRGLAVDRNCLLGDARANWPRGARLRAVNGHDADSLFAVVQSVLSGPDAYRRAVAGDQFPYLLWAHGIDAPFRLTVDRPGDDTDVVTVDGIGFGRVRGCLAPAPASPFDFRRLDRDVGLLTVRSLTQPWRFRNFLASVADSVARRPVNGWIVDLRDNDGGRTKVAQQLLGTLTTRPVRLITRKEWKVSRPYKERLRTRRGSDAFRPYLDERDGTVLRIRYDAEPPPRVPLRLRGPVAVLIGPHTFSSAVTLAATIDAYDLATLVGRETGGRANRFGEGYPFRLSHSGLQAMVSSAYFVQASGNARMRGGVRPRVPVAAPVGVSSDLTLGVAMAWMR